MVTKLINELFKEFLIRFPNERGPLVSKNTISYKILKHDILNFFKEKIKKELKVSASIGQGRSAEVPWVAIFDPQRTRTATEGIYLVYLIKEDCSGMYLSLNQGITTFNQLYKSSMCDFAEKVALKIRKELNLTGNLYSNEKISLSKKAKKSWRVKGYERANIVSKYYDFEQIKYADLLNDLENYLELYLNINKFVPYDYRDFVKNVIEETDPSIIDIGDTYEETNRVIQHRDLKLNYNEPNKNQTKKFEFFQSKIIRKTDYLNKVIKDHQTGLEGEAWVYRHEKERLKKLGQAKLAKKVRWASKISDNLGYDIESFDEIEGFFEKIFIEVKTTIKQSDEPFYVSKNELNVSKLRGKNYRLLRVYDATSTKPMFYFRNGFIGDNFEIDPISFLAYLK
jgi:hypothetical protein